MIEPTDISYEKTVLVGLITQYQVDGDNVITKISFVTYLYDNEIPDENGEMHYPDYLGTVHINDTQYFADVPTNWFLLHNKKLIVRKMIFSNLLSQCIGAMEDF